MILVDLIKKKQYISLIEKLIKEKARDEEINEAYVAYRKYCYEHDILDELDYAEIMKNKLIIPVNPKLYFGNQEKLAEAANKVRNAFKSEIDEGITEEEAHLMLDWVVENTHQATYDGATDNTISSMESYSSFMQSIVAIPFMNIGAPVIIGDTKNFNDGFSSHPFVIVKLPIKTEMGVLFKEYLIDPTYMQFFAYVNASAALFYDTRKEFKGKVGPSAGFYVCKTEEGIRFATELIKNGYIEFNKENARIYGSGFECEMLNINNYSNWEDIIGQPGEHYIDIINSNKGKLSYNPVNVEIDGVPVRFPKEEAKIIKQE